MKRVFPILVIISFLGLVLQMVVTVFVKNDDTSYTLKTEDNVYTITENLNVLDNVSYYDIGITDSNGDFYSVTLNNNFNKQTEIIRDIKYFKENNLSCIFPIYRRDITDNVTCLYNGELVSYSYLKQHNNTDLSSIVNKLQSDGYKHNSWSRTEVQKINLYEEGKGIDVYQENINNLKDYTFLIWRYKGLYILKNDTSYIRDYLSNDVYDNSLSRLVGKYYVTPVIDSATHRLSEIYYYNTRELGRGSILLPEQISSDFYFNGIYDSHLYMTDLGNSKQYTIDPAYEKVVEVGNKEKGFIVLEDNKLKTVDATEFLSNKKYFNNFITSNDVTTKYGTNEIIQERMFYYFKTQDGRFYRAHIDNQTNAELLFKFDNISQWKIKNGEIVIVTGNMVYFYSDREGLVPIAYNRELTYNYNNIVDFWKE